MGDTIRTPQTEPPFGSPQYEVPGLQAIIDSRPNRYGACDTLLFDAKDLFFSSRFRSDAVLTDADTPRFRIYSHAISAIPLQPQEKLIYRRWLKLSPKDALQRGREASMPTDEETMALGQRDDPAMHVIHTLERLRIVHFPNYGRELVLARAALRSYGLLLSSIHGTIDE